MMSTLRAAVLTAGIMLLGAKSLADAPAESGKRVAVNIEAQPLTTALNKWAEQTGMMIMVTAEGAAETLIAPRVVGDYTAEEALVRLLDETQFSYQFVNSRTVAIHSKEAGSGARKTSASPKGNEAAQMQLASADATSAGRGSSASGRESEEAIDRDAADSPQNPQDIKLDEIVVTAQKRIERLQDVPMSISVLTGDMIERRTMVSANDFLKYVPGVAYEDYAAGSNGLRIRGIDAGVGVYMGDMPIGSGVDLKLVDMQRVEVLRGPQGTLYGAGSMGGTLRYIPNAPDMTQLTGNVDVGYSRTSGNAGEDVTGVLNLPLVQDKLALRVAGYFYETAGYIRYVGNSIPTRVAFAESLGGTLLNGDDGGSSEYTGGRATLLWQPVESFSAALTYAKQRIRQNGSFEDNPILQPYENDSLSFGAFTEDGGDIRRNSASLYNLALNLELAKFDVAFSTSYLDYGWGEARLLDAPIEFLGVFPASSTTRAATQELRVNSKLDRAFNFMLGLYYEDSSYLGDANVAWLGDSAHLPAFLGTTDPNGLYFSNDHGFTRQKAVFSELYFDLSEKVKLTFGGRFFDYDRYNYSLVDGILNGGLKVTDNDAGEDGTTFKANLTYAHDRDTMVYLQWAQGFRLGNGVTAAPRETCDTDNDGLLDGTNAPINGMFVKSDSVDSWELGSKSAFFDGRWALNAAAYRVEWDKIPGGVSAECGFTVSVNVGKARAQGVELESSFAVTPRVSLSFNASVIDAQLIETAGTLGSHVVVGDELPTPPFQAGLGLEYRLNVLGHEGYVRGDYSYVDTYHLSFAERFQEIAGYGKVDVRAELALGAVTAAVYATNLTNKDALTGSQMPDWPRSWHLQPRTVGVQFGYQF